MNRREVLKTAGLATLTENFLSTDSIDVAFNVLVWKKDKQIILFDAGCGPHFGPNARVWIARQEYDFWMREKPDLSGSKVDPAFAAGMVKLAKTNLTAVKHQLNFFRGGETLFDAVKLEIAPGHTPGHTISRLGTGQKDLVHMGDISHDHVLLLSHPEWGVAFDTDLEAAAKTRRATLQNLAMDRSWIFSYHLPWPGLGFVRAKGEAFEWIQQPFSTPQL